MLKKIASYFDLPIVMMSCVFPMCIISTLQGHVFEAVVCLQFGALWLWIYSREIL